MAHAFLLRRPVFMMCKTIHSLEHGSVILIIVNSPNLSCSWHKIPWSWTELFELKWPTEAPGNSQGALASFVQIIGPQYRKMKHKGFHSDFSLGPFSLKATLLGMSLILWSSFDIICANQSSEELQQVERATLLEADLPQRHMEIFYTLSQHTFIHSSPHGTFTMHLLCVKHYAFV